MSLIIQSFWKFSECVCTWAKSDSYCWQLEGVKQNYYETWALIWVCFTLATHFFTSKGISGETFSIGTAVMHASTLYSFCACVFLSKYERGVDLKDQPLKYYVCSMYLVYMCVITNDDMLILRALIQSLCIQSLKVKYTLWIYWVSLLK